MQVVIDTINEAYEPIQVRQVIEALHQDVSAHLVVDPFYSHNLLTWIYWKQLERIQQSQLCQNC